MATEPKRITKAELLRAAKETPYEPGTWAGADAYERGVVTAAKALGWEVLVEFAADAEGARAPGPEQ